MLKFKSLLLFLLLITSDLYSQEIVNNPDLWYPTNINKYKCNIIKIKDGDTFVADVLIPEFHVMLLSRDIRVWSFDAPEITKKRQSVDVTDEEIKKGKEALSYFVFLSQKYHIYVSPRINETDPYGRTLCIVWLSDTEHEARNQYMNFNEVMTKAGYSRVEKNDK